MRFARLAVFMTGLLVSAEASSGEAVPWIDCKIPQGDEEQILCGQKSLKEKYDALVGQFQAQFKRAPEVLRPAMARNFSAWNKYLKAVCAEKGAPNGESDYTEGCLKSALFYKERDFNKEFKCNKYIGCYLHVNSYEVFYRQDRGEGTGADRRNVFFSKKTSIIFEKPQKNIPSEHWDFIPDTIISDEEAMSVGMEWEFYDGFQVASINKHFINIKKIEWFYAGGAHGYGEEFYRSYKNSDKTPLNSNIFRKNMKWQQEFLSAAIDDLKVPKAYNDFQEFLSEGFSYNDYSIINLSGEEFEKMILSKAWAFEADAIVIYLNPSDFGLAVSGLKQIHIPYERLSKYFKKEFSQYIGMRN